MEMTCDLLIKKPVSLARIEHNFKRKILFLQFANE